MVSEKRFSTLLWSAVGYTSDRTTLREFLSNGRTVPACGAPEGNAKTFRFSINKDKLRLVCRREGQYLLHSKTYARFTLPVVKTG